MGLFEAILLALGIQGGLWALGNEIRRGMVQAAEIAKANAGCVDKPDHK